VIAVVWLFAVLGVLSWSVVVWAMHVLLSLSPETLAGWHRWIDAFPWSAPLDRWFGGWDRVAHWSVDALQWLVGAVAGHLDEWVATVWAAGAGAMLLVALLVHAGVRLLQGPAGAASTVDATAST